MTLGQVIMKARKDAGISIDELSAATNIRATLLGEIENNNFEHCGGETYARGHLRNIATKLGVAPQMFLAAFEAEQVQSSRSMADLLTENSVMNQPDQPRKISWKVLALISLVSIILIGIVQIIISNSSSTGVLAPQPSASSSPTPSATAQPTPENSAPVSTGTGVEVVITATRSKSWLFVSDAAGRTLFSGQILTGESKLFTSDVSLNLRLGNAGGVDLKVNGKDVGVIGGNGEVVNLSYGVDS